MPGTTDAGRQRMTIFYCKYLPIKEALIFIFSSLSVFYILMMHTHHYPPSFQNERVNVDNTQSPGMPSCSHHVTTTNTPTIQIHPHYKYTHTTHTHQHWLLFYIRIGTNSCMGIEYTPTHRHTRDWHRSYQDLVM